MTKFLFLDRDGVIIKDYGYVYKKKDIHFISGIFEFCRNLKKANFKIYIITNQSGIARSIFSQNEFEIAMDYIISSFKKKNIFIDGYKFCPHLPNSSKSNENLCECRKPGIGMLQEISESYLIDKENSIFIGDKISDVECGHNFGISNNILISKKQNIKKDFQFIIEPNAAAAFRRAEKLSLKEVST